MPIFAVKGNISEVWFASETSRLSAARVVRDFDRAVTDTKERPVRTMANQLRRFWSFWNFWLPTCIAVACMTFGVSGAVAQLLPNAGGQTVFDPYPANQNPFRSDSGSPLIIEEPADLGSDITTASFLDAEVQPAQFSEMVPNAVDEASLGASVLSDNSKPDTAGAVTGNSSTGPETMPGPELNGPSGEYIGQPIGEFVSEFAPVITEEDSALLYSSSSWFRRGVWYSQQDFVMMVRGQVEEILVAVDADRSGPPTLPDGSLGNDPLTVSNIHRPTLTMADAPLTYEPGMRLTLGRFLGQDVNNRDHSFEVTFFGLLEHTGSGVLERNGANNGLFTALDGGTDYFIAGNSIFRPGSFPSGFSPTTRNTLQYRTRLNSMELNWKVMGRPNRDRLALQPTGAWVRHAAPSRLRTGLIGLRGVSLKENLTYRAGIGDVDTGLYRIGTSNDMLGVQLGGEMAEYYSDWAIGGKFKAAGLVNFADRRDVVDVFDFQATAPVINEANDEHLAILLEAGISAVRHFTPNITGRLGYDFMYLTGIADAPNNANLSPSFSRFEVTNDAYYHGLSMGFEMLW